MAYDRRYPHAFPIERQVPALNAWELANARDIAGPVCRRTGTRCFFLENTGSLLFCYDSEPHGGPLILAFKTATGTRNYHGGDIDDMVRVIQMGKLSAKEKRKVLARNAEVERWGKEDAMNKHLDERRPDALSYAGFRSRKRRGVEKIISA